jgi:hypothetical protein
MNKLNVTTGHCEICEGNLYNNETFCFGCVSQYGVSND